MKWGSYLNEPLQLNQCIERLMHLLFLDIVKPSSTLIKEWIKATNIVTSYKKKQKRYVLMHS